jgi:splicing factor 3B subunit 3
MQFTNRVPGPAAVRILDRGARLELLHKTQLEGIPGALTAFKGRLLAGVGPVLRLFELGRKKLLRKCEYRQLPQHVAQLHTLGSRIYVADVQVRHGGQGRRATC